MSYTKEFETVDLILQSCAPTRGVDAFALSVIKAERQMRKLFTHLVFQCPAFGATDIPPLRQALADNGGIYFEGFMRGIDALYPRTVAQFIGAEHDTLLPNLKGALLVRNKIFHGQLTEQSQRREALIEYVTGIRRWCQLLSEAAMREIGYDGFERGSSFTKAGHDLAATYRMEILTVQGYTEFLRAWVERPRGRVWQPQAGQRIRC